MVSYYFLACNLNEEKFLLFFSLRDILLCAFRFLFKEATLLSYLKETRNCFYTFDTTITLYVLARTTNCAKDYCTRTNPVELSKTIILFTDRSSLVIHT